MTYWRHGVLQEARTALERAVGLLNDSPSPPTVRVLVDLATLLIIHIGEQDKEVAYIQQVQEIADRLGDNLLQATVAGVVARKDFVSVNDLLSTLQSMERAMAIIDAHDDSCEAAECSLLGKLALLDG